VFIHQNIFSVPAACHLDLYEEEAGNEEKEGEEEKKKKKK
jgi:hypothetical protein